MAEKGDDKNDFLPVRNEDIKSMFKIFSKSHHPYLMPSDTRWMPAADVFETDEEFILIIDIAHIDPKDIELFMKKGYIVVKGIRREITKFKKRHYHKMEIDYGPFERKISVPVAVDEHNIKTQYKDGFMEIRLQKIVDRRGSERTINIEWEE